MEKLEAAVAFCQQHRLSIDFSERSDLVFVHYTTGSYMLSAQGHDLVAAVVALRTDMETVGIVKGATV